MPPILRTSLTCATLAAGLLLPTTPCVAQVQAIGPFSGSLTENSNQYSSNMAVQTLPVFGGFGTLQNLSDGGSLKVEWSSSLSGDLVVPMSGMMTGQLGIAQWVFDEPVSRFGGYFENNSFADDARLEFFDANDELLGEVVAVIPADAQQWTWNGWEFDTPVSRILVTGNGIINGFIWYENMEVDPAVPCVTDVDGSGVTDVDDLVAVILAWGTGDPAADVDGSGLVGVGDLVAVVLGWGACP